MDQERFSYLQHEITKLAKTEEGIWDIAYVLAKTNWNDVFRVESIRTCFWCAAIFECSQAGYFALCPDCEVRLCGLCKCSTFEKTGLAYRIICQPCLTEYHINNDWCRREASKINLHEMRARQVGKPSRLPFRPWLATLKYFHWKCAYCQEKPYEVLEHFIPVLLLGETSVSNCVPACRQCDRTKKNHHPHKVTHKFPQGAIKRVQTYLDQFSEFSKIGQKMP